ncbi:acyltransferase family protein [Vibrio sp.]|nr:acyltransferase family protein [Vibrio sp.]
MLNDRIKYIDIAKGITIILVVMFHSHVKSFFPNITAAVFIFLMPLFFFLSGVFFSTRLDFFSFVVKKVDSLLKPYIIVGIVVIVLYCVIGNYSKDFMLGLLYGNGGTLIWVPMWFLTHLFLISCFSYFLFQIPIFEKSTGINAFIIFIALFIFGYILFTYINSHFPEDFESFKDVGLPFSLDLLCMTTSYFILGRMTRNSVLVFRPHMAITVLFLIAFILLNIYYEPQMDFNERVFHNIPIALVCSLMGIYLTLVVSFYVSKLRLVAMLFAYVGQSSLYILIFHFAVVAKSYPQLEKYLGNCLPDVLLAFISLTIGVIVPLVLKQLIESNKFSKYLFKPVS